MVLSIKDPRTDALARELASVTEETLTAAIHTAIQERLDRVTAEQGRAAKSDQLRDYITRGRARRTTDHGSVDELLYDECGLPA